MKIFLATLLFAGLAAGVTAALPFHDESELPTFHSDAKFVRHDRRLKGSKSKDVCETPSKANAATKFLTRYSRRPSVARRYTNAELEELLSPYVDHLNKYAKKGQTFTHKDVLKAWYRNKEQRVRDQLRENGKLPDLVPTPEISADCIENVAVFLADIIGLFFEVLSPFGKVTEAAEEAASAATKSLNLVSDLITIWDNKQDSEERKLWYTLEAVISEIGIKGLADFLFEKLSWWQWIIDGLVFIISVTAFVATDGLSEILVILSLFVDLAAAAVHLTVMLETCVA